ncbi:hypothetical protein ACFC18_45375 [Streptomyces sp. NPDC056121]|uniref:hypothetical protein n=1 Tax=Streptomyces sp. NPDC056121 TaxID=3345718 RepID=UPI0035E27880
MKAPDASVGNTENFTFQARALLDQVAGVAESLPACATFADALRTMEIIQAVVTSVRQLRASDYLSRTPRTGVGLGVVEGVLGGPLLVEDEPVGQAEGGAGN